jgi:hypothetical protein
MHESDSEVILRIAAFDGDFDIFLGNIEQFIAVARPSYLHRFEISIRYEAPIVKTATIHLLGMVSSAPNLLTSILMTEADPVLQIACIQALAKVIKSLRHA